MYFRLEFKSFCKKEASSLSLYLRLQILHQLLGVAGIPDLDGQDLGRIWNGGRKVAWGKACVLSKRGTLFLAFHARILSKFSLLRNTVKVGAIFDSAILQLLGGSNRLLILGVIDLAT